MDSFENTQSLDNQFLTELSNDELDLVNGGKGGKGSFEVEIKDAGGLISKGIGGAARVINKADSWRKSNRGPNLLRHIGSIKIGL